MLITVRQALQPSEKSKSFCSLQMALGSTMKKVSQGLGENYGAGAASKLSSREPETSYLSYLPLSRLGVRLLVARRSPQAG